MAVKRKEKDQAHDAAIAGDIGTAVPKLEALLAGGDVGAAASLAEIQAFRGRWLDVTRYAFAFLRHPSSVYAQGNFFDAMTNLVAVAGLMLGNWTEIHEEATATRAHLLATGELAPNLDGHNKFAYDLDQLLEFARSQGKATYVSSWWGALDERGEDARAEEFDAGLVYLSAKKKPWKDDVDRRRNLFSLALAKGSRRSAIRLFEQESMDDLLNYDSMVFVASSLARAGRADDAWQVVEKTLPHWWPVDVAQMAPVVLLTDEGLRPLMTAERCEWVLRTPRGPAALPPKTATSKKVKPTKKK